MMDIQNPLIICGVNLCGTNIVKRLHPIVAQRQGASRVWRKMIGQNKWIGTMWKKIKGRGGDGGEILL